MQLVPAGVVKATSSPSGVLVPPRNATWKSAASTGPASCTQEMASPTVAPGSGADVVALVVVEPVEEGVVEGVVEGEAWPAGRDGEMGVSLPVPGVSVDGEHPATSSPAADKAANTPALRIRPG